MTLTKIVTGGQTGIDRGALDAALEAGFPCGGWAPEGRAAEDGRIPRRYPLQELAGAGYEERTLQNVVDSDGTAILYSGKLEGGTRKTMLHCVEHGKPFELVDATRAGPRASKWPQSHQYAHSTVRNLLSAYSSPGKPGSR